MKNNKIYSTISLCARARRLCSGNFSVERVAAEGELMSYTHNGYWQCMDTKREMDMLENLWQSGNAPWKSW